MTDFVGSGRFVPVREWTCSQHDIPQRHACDCEECEIPDYTCEECEWSEWVDALDENDQPIMRELGIWEWSLWPLDGPIQKRVSEKVDWLEDEYFPGTA